MQVNIDECPEEADLAHLTCVAQVGSNQVGY